MQAAGDATQTMTWMLNGFPWWVHVGVVVLAGLFGGLLNAILAGGPLHGIRLGGWGADEDGPARVLHLGVWGSMLVGVGASLAAWATAFYQTQLPAMIAGCFFAGIAGANYLTSRVQQAVTEQELRNQEQSIIDLVNVLRERETDAVGE